jgi:hypothetical protein
MSNYPAHLDILSKDVFRIARFVLIEVHRDDIKS